MILVSGYYGFANLGDEAILQALCADLTALGVKRQEILVLSNDPRRTETEHRVRAVYRYDLPKIWSALASARLLVSGGGSLLQDVTSKRSIPYYVGLVELALLLRVPVVMYAQGLGPVQNRFLRAWVRRAFLHSKACTVRDQESLEFLSKLGVPREKVVLAADPVFQQEVIENVPNSKRLLLNIRPYESWEQQQSIWLKHLALWQEQGYEVEFIPLGPGDSHIGKFLQSHVSSLLVHPDLELASYSQVLNGAKLCISMRLHGLILSALSDCLPIGLNYDPKVAAISSQLQIPCWEMVNVDSLGRGIGQVLQNEKQLKLDYHKALRILRQRSLTNRQVLAEVLR